MLDEYLSDFHCDLLIRTGNPVKSLLTAALQHRCDLILLAHTTHLTIDLGIIKFSVAEVMRNALVPVLLVPDPKPSGTVQFPINRIHVHLNARETSRLSTAFALRSARLLGQHASLSASGDSSEKVNDYLEFIRDRYWPPDRKDGCHIEPMFSSPARDLRQTVMKEKPDLLILTLQDYSFLERFRIIDAVKNILQSLHIPILVVNRRDWIAQQEKQLSRIYNRLTELDLAHTGQNKMNLEICGDYSQTELLMGCYSLDGLNEVFHQYGLFKSLEKRGYPAVQICFNNMDSGRERLRVFPDRDDIKEPLVDLVFRKETAPITDNAPLDFPALSGPYLYIEWLCLQDPNRSYRNLEIPLPGQKYPGLGMGWKVMLIIKLLARRIGAVGVYNMPEYYHTARLYHRYFRYVNPILEGRLLAIDRDTFPLHVVDTSWAALHGLILENGQTMSWTGGPQILPLEQGLKNYFESAEYRKAVHRTMIRERFTLDNENLCSMMKNRGLYREPSSV